jgi:hypothetical protein
MIRSTYLSRQRERGTSVVETAFSIPVFLVLIFATLEFGLVFRDYMTVANAARDSARYASTLGNDPDADFETLQEIVGNVGSASDLEMVVIFKATGPGSTTASGTLAECRSVSVSGLCNRYSGAEISTLSTAYGCGSAALDRFWCPAGRRTKLSDPPDYVGVYLQYRHTGVTGAFGTTILLDDEVVLRLEPNRA